MGVESTLITVILIGVDAIGAALFYFAYTANNEMMLVFMATLLIVFNFVFVLILKSGILPADQTGGSQFMSTFKSMNMGAITGKRKFGKFKGLG